MPATNELLQEGRYRINHQNPLSGNANVYDAYDTVGDANVVVKEIIVRLNRVTTMSQQEMLKTEFANQAKILTEIQHDSLLQVKDFFSEIGRQYLVMESVDGDDLAELLERNRSAFAVSDVVEWADQLLDALNYLHTFQPPIIHRGVRPQHIKLSSAGRIKLLAFGLSNGGDVPLSTTLREDGSESSMSYSPLELIWDGLDAASQKVIANSYDDRSERLLKEPADARTDIYSLGATLYHLVTGRVPVDPLERSIELLDGKPDPLKAPHKIDPKIPVEFSEVLMRSLEIKRENRFDSAVIMRQVVRTAMVRVREREEEEARELEEAAEDIRMAEQLRLAQANKAADAERLAAEAEERHKQEILDNQRLAEEAERRAAIEAAAEAERLLKEKEEAAARAKEEELAREAAAREEEERAKAEAAAKAQAEAEAVLRELKEDLLDIDADDEIAERTSDDIHASGTDDEVLDTEVLEAAEIVDIDLIEDEAVDVAYVATAEVVAYDAAIAEPSLGRAASPVDDEIELGGVFSADAGAGKSGLGMPMIAGIAGVVLVLAVVGWFLFASGTKAPEPVATQPPPAAQVPVQEPVQQVNTAVETVREPVVTADEPAVEASAPAAVRQAAQAPAPKAKRPAADAGKPAPEKKKAVTVDDLINDN